MSHEHGAILRDKTIRCKICHSKSLSRCSREADLAFSRILHIADDWGCFEYDIEVVHSVIFAKRKNEWTEKDLEKWLDEYHDNGMLFRWRVGDKKYGFFVNHDKYFPWSDKRKAKRKTPIPPLDGVETYINAMHKKFGSQPEESSNATPF